jgi:predicted transcriptional regulator
MRIYGTNSLECAILHHVEKEGLMPRTRARGELESLILSILRDSQDPLNAGEIQLACTEPTPAYTTVLTALERLRQKGDVERVGEAARGIRFVATRSDQEQALTTIADALDASRDRDGVLLKFAGTLSEREVSLLQNALRDR